MKIINAIPGLLEEEMRKLHGIVSSHEDIDEVVLYGSRAKGDFRPGSDIDLTLKGEGLSLNVLTDLLAGIDDLLLPYTVDLSIFDDIDNLDLIDHINRVGKVVFSND
ncbi:nucleotidyltransferase domain-containing protein [Pontiellaceae bacterium B12227]|nr:nucleotidyltransferase domain-containing protein [Pontiellaceae bacterium B12227]